MSSISQSIKEQIDWDVKRLGNAVNHLDNKLFGYTADDIIMSFQSSASEQDRLLNRGVAQAHCQDNAAK